MAKRQARIVEHPAASREPAPPVVMSLELAQIQCYERNPRRSRNPEYDRIKASILASGLDQPLRITRRPGATTYIVQAGGNTRLQILNELYASTGDERFNRVDCLYVEWQHESAVLLAHLRENDLRGDLTFIDKAQAVLDLRALLAGERGVPKISHRQLATLLKQRGYHASHVTVALMDYAVSVLLPAMPAALHAGLGRPQLQRIRNLERVGRGLWQRARLGELTEFRDMFRALCRRHDAVDWQFGLLRQALETELAEAAEAGLQSIRMAFERGLSGQAADVADPWSCTRPATQAVRCPRRYRRGSRKNHKLATAIRSLHRNPGRPATVGMVTDPP